MEEKLVSVVCLYGFIQTSSTAEVQNVVGFSGKVRHQMREEWNRLLRQVDCFFRQRTDAHLLSRSFRELKGVASVLGWAKVEEDVLPLLGSAGDVDDQQGFNHVDQSISS